MLLVKSRKDLKNQIFAEVYSDILRSLRPAAFSKPLSLPLSHERYILERERERERERETTEREREREALSQSVCNERI
jgi:hypothetical protein